jgi:uncharacterized protein YbjT (DUF2867 family)
MDSKKLKVLVTGSTGMVGEGVLQVCLDNPNIEKVVALNRRTVGFSHPKMTEILLPDFHQLNSVESQLKGLDACYHCMGISSIGTDEAIYKDITYTLSILLGETMSRLNPGSVFCYLSGAGTDATEKGKLGWARLKGRTENELSKMPFSAMYRYRPGFIKPLPGATHVQAFYKYVDWFFPIGKALFPEGFSTLEEIGRSMIQVTLKEDETKTLAGKDIRRLSNVLKG